MSGSKTVQAVVAGHICLDLIPALGRTAENFLKPGTMLEIGAPRVSLGGTVGNTGLALKRLGITTRLVAKVGRDFMGDAIVARLGAASGIIRDPKVASSYSVVISPKGRDRSFMHCPGANASFSEKDVPDRLLRGARILHFGYPPLMARMMRDQGAELRSLLARAKRLGLATSLDMAHPDPASAPPRGGWGAWLSKVLPNVDFFMPSLDEMAFMLKRGASDPTGLADDLLGMGCGVVVLKMGADGLYLKSGKNSEGAWKDREIWAPSYKVNVVGTTGAGDCSIAGFLAAWSKGEGPSACLNAGAAAGAFCVEQLDSSSGVPDWAGLKRRQGAGWPRKGLSLKGWLRQEDGCYQRRK
ncbi:MAG: carbohydrate kinase family protein [candidate division FCPU426 bacterium]